MSHGCLGESSLVCTPGSSTCAEPACREVAPPSSARAERQELAAGRWYTAVRDCSASRVKPAGHRGMKTHWVSGASSITHTAPPWPGPVRCHSLGGCEQVSSRARWSGGKPVPAAVGGERASAAAGSVRHDRSRRRDAGSRAAAGRSAAAGPRYSGSRAAVARVVGHTSDERASRVSSQPQLLLQAPGQLRELLRLGSRHAYGRITSGVRSACSVSSCARAPGTDHEQVAGCTRSSARQSASASRFRLA